MIRCDMCGMDVPVGPNGRCFLGHVLPGNVAPAAVVAPPVEPVGAEPALAQDRPDLAAPPFVTPVVVPQPAVLSPQPEPVAAPEIAASFGSAIEREPVEQVPLPQSQPASVPGFIAPRPLGAPAGGFTSPRPLGSAPPQTLPSAQPPALSMPSTRPVSPSMPSTQPHASVGQSFATPPATQAPVSSPLPPGVTHAVTQGSAALAVAPDAAPAAAPVGELFVVASGGKRAPNKVLLLVLVLALLGGAAFAAKTFFGSGDAAAESVAAGPGPAPVREAGSLARAYVDDERHAYRLDMKLTTTVRHDGETERFDAEMDMAFTETVTDRRPDGSATIRYTFDAASVRADGREVAIPFSPGMGLEVSVGPNGKVSSVKQIGGGDLPVDSSFYDMLAPVLPPNAKPGARWSRVDRPSLPNVGEMKVSTAFHYLKDEGGAAVVESTSEAPFSLSLGADQLGELATGAGGTFELKGRLLSKGRQTVDKVSGRTLSATADMAMTFAAVQDGVEKGRMAMSITFALAPAGVSHKTA